jgi:hypothetical protein
MEADPCVYGSCYPNSSRKQTLSPPDVPTLAVVVESFTYERRVAKPLRDTLYREVQVHRDETLDGTNYACERAISWWIKEHYRTMRGYKVRENAVRVSRLLAWCGNFFTTVNGAKLPGFL